MPPKTQKKQLNFTTSPAEKTTAITDILLSLVAAGGIYYLQQLESPKYWNNGFVVRITIIVAVTPISCECVLYLVFGVWYFVFCVWYGIYELFAG